MVTKVQSELIANNAILTQHIDDNQVTADQIADATITTTQIAANTIATGNIADNAIDSTKIASNSILTRHIDDDQVTGDQLADNITIAGTLSVTGATTLSNTVGVGTTNTNTEATLSVLQEDTGNDTTSAINIHGTGNGSDGTTTTNLFRAVTNNANNWAHGKMFADGFTFTYGNTNTNRLKIENDGQIQIGSSNVGTDIVKFVGNTNLGAPNTANHATGTRLSLYDSSSTAWYAIGMESNSMWLQSDQHYKFYVDASQKIQFDSTNPMPIIRCGTDATNAMRLGSVTIVAPYSGISLVKAEAGGSISIHNTTNSVTTWNVLSSSLPDYLAGTAFINTINTSQQANIILYVNSATKAYLVRDSGWNSVSLTDWVRISDDNVYGSGDSRVYVRYLHPGTYSLDNDSALYFFEAPIGP